MLHLIRSDLYKLKKSNYLWVCLLIALILGTGTIFLLDFTYKMTGDQMQAQLEQAQSEMEETGVSVTTSGIPASYEELSASSQLLSFFSGESTLLLAVVISLFVGGEFTYGTIKNLVSRSYSRGSIYASKFIVGTLVSILFAVLYAAVSTITATALWGFGTVSKGFLPDLLTGIALELFLNAAYAAIFLMFSILIRQNGGSLAANICFLEFLSLFAMLGEMLLKKLLNHTVSLSAYLPDTVMQAVASQELTSSLITRALAVGAGFMIVSTIIGSISFIRRDIR